MVLGSHNAWSFAKPKKWWAKLIRFTAKCQQYNIQDQYEKFGSRCFDLRIKFNSGGIPSVVHGPIEYNVDLFEDLEYINNKGDCSIRVVLDIRNSKVDVAEQQNLFIRFCKDIEQHFTNIKFFCGENIVTKEVIYDFGNSVSCEELYASVTYPKLIDDWFPWIYAKLHNKKNISKGTDREVLLIDFVNIQ